MGNTPEDVASVIVLDVPPGSRVFVSQDECLPAFRDAVHSVGAELIEVARGVSPAHRADEMAFTENSDMVYAVARSLEIDDVIFERGIAQTRPDVGELGMWRYRVETSARTCVAVNAFAANDPASTMLVYDKVMDALERPAGECIGLMNLRADRGDRTLQWAEALENGVLARFSRLYLSGLHAKALARRLRRSNSISIDVLGTTQPEEVMRLVTPAEDETDGIVFGLGNIAGLGQAMVAHWIEVGEPVTG
jgi:hypothetical protein